MFEKIERRESNVLAVAVWIGDSRMSMEKASRFIMKHSGQRCKVSYSQDQI